MRLWASESVRIWTIEGDPGAPVDLLWPGSGHDSPYCRAVVAGNLGAPDDMLMRLAADVDVAVRCVVAGNPSLPAEGIARCSQDPDRDIRSAAARNPSTALGTRLVLLHDADPMAQVSTALAIVGVSRHA